MLTNRACGHLFGDRRTTVREIFEPKPFKKLLALSRMSNLLGLNRYVMISDTKTIPLVLRKKIFSIAKRQWGASIGVSFKTA